MARPRNQKAPTGEPLKEVGANLTGYDKYVISVNRTQTKKGDAITESIEVRKKLRTNIKIGEPTADLQNNLQDFRNKTAAGEHIIQWFFPTGTVSSGLQYAAKQEKAKDNDGEETNNLILVIDTSKSI